MIALHLLRHAHAGDPERWHGDDAQRPLSDKGRRQAERLGKLLDDLGEAPDVFITSPKVRARQTAELVAAELDARVVEDRRLGGGLDLSALSEILLAHPDAQRPCVVGHDPDFSELLGELLGITLVPMRKGAMARVDVAGRNLVGGGGQLRWLLPPELVPGK